MTMKMPRFAQIKINSPCKLKNMKRINTKSITGSILLALISFGSYSQSYAKTNTDTSQLRMKIDKNQIPKEVKDAFSEQYPLATNGDWYCYPSSASAADWYSYDANYIGVGDANSYDIEFISDGTPYKAIYARGGAKIASHRGIETGMPAAVTDAISNGDYKSWTLGKDKQEIYKDSDSDQQKVYRVNVLNGNEKHTLYFQQDGKMLRDIKIV
jgi:hypothetical protein